MLIKTSAIVLHCQPYGDNTYIVHLYTRDFGRVGYMARLVSGKRTGIRRALLQPLTLVEIQADHKANRQLQQLRDARTLSSVGNVLCDVGRTTVSLFLAEVLYRSIRETERNPNLFEFLSRSIQLLDLCEKGLANFHLVFLIKLTRYLGFYPNLEGQQPGWFFDLYGGEFVPHQPLHNAWLNPVESALFAKLMRITYENMGAYAFNHHERMELLRQMLNYYRMHLTDFPAIKSLDVLEEVFKTD